MVELSFFRRLLRALVFFSIYGFAPEWVAATPCFVWMKRLGNNFSDIWYHSDALELNRNPDSVYVVQTQRGGFRRSFNRWVDNASPLEGKSLRWPVKYASVTYSEMMPSFPYAGVNEYGVKIALIPIAREIFGRHPSLEDLKVTEESDSFLDGPRYAWLSAFELLQVVLDTAKNVEEAKNRLRRLNHMPQPFGMEYQIVLCDSRKCRVALPDDGGLSSQTWKFFRIPKRISPLITRLPITSVFDHFNGIEGTAILSGQPVLHDYETRLWNELTARLSTQDEIVVADAQSPVVRLSNVMTMSWRGKSIRFGFPSEDTQLVKLTVAGVETYASSDSALVRNPIEIFAPDDHEGSRNIRAAYRFQSRFIRAAD